MRYLGVAVLSMAIVGATGAADTVPPPDPAGAFVHLHSPRLACLGSQSEPAGCVRLSAGYFMDEPTYAKLDLSVKALQDDKTRLEAENASLRKTVSTWQPGWKSLLVTTLTALALGAYVEHKI